MIHRLIEWWPLFAANALITFVVGYIVFNYLIRKRERRQAETWDLTMRRTYIPVDAHTIGGYPIFGLKKQVDFYDKHTGWEGIAYLPVCPSGKQGYTLIYWSKEGAIRTPFSAMVDVDGNIDMKSIPYNILPSH